ncbi:winged helix-turn-helix domain-containing protein [Polaromonas sp. P1-6]|nr:winged helix-turn-helix domain-containing protein [Polaromonas sp. P1-6]
MTMEGMLYNAFMNMSTPKTAAKQEGGQPLSAEQVCDRIRATILKGELKPGDKLTEQDLAAQYKVSRTPVRGSDPPAGSRTPGIADAVCRCDRQAA